VEAGETVTTKFYKCTPQGLVETTADDPNRMMTKAETEAALVDRTFVSMFLGLGAGFVLNRLLKKAGSR